MAQPIDLELKQAFVDLQQQMVETKKSLDIIDHQLVVLGRMQMHTGLTKREVDALPPSTKTYESMARMFILSDLDQVKKNLELKTESMKTRIEDLNNRKVIANKTLNESETYIRDLIQQKKKIESTAEASKK